jgi:hypothetical protein
MKRPTSLHKPHRKAWYDHYGDIPVDSDGVTFEIHHINGDRTDNRIENLTCVSIIDHYNIHLAQGDAYACESIHRRMTENRLIREGKLTRLSLKGKNHPLYGIGHTEETKRKLSENHHDVSGKNNPMYGRKHTEESRRKMSQSKIGINKGVPKSPETKEKMRQAALKRWAKRRSEA